MDESKLDKPEEIADNDLDCVTGGAGAVTVCRTATRRGKYYVYDGPMTVEALTNAYLCPKCGHAIHWKASRVHSTATCEGCGAIFWDKAQVDINMRGGLWKEVSEAEYLCASEGGRLQ